MSNRADAMFERMVELARQRGWKVEVKNLDFTEGQSAWVTTGTERWYETPIYVHFGWFRSELTGRYHFGAARISSPKNTARRAIERKLHTWPEVSMELVCHGPNHADSVAC